MSEQQKDDLAAYFVAGFLLIGVLAMPFSDYFWVGFVLSAVSACVRPPSIVGDTDGIYGD